MKITTEYIVSLVFCVLASISAHAQKDGCLFEAEDFQFTGKWTVERNTECMGGKMLKAGNGRNEESTDALTVVEISRAGNYEVWVRSMDFETYPGTRLLRLSVNEKPMAEAGKHGIAGLHWENVGSIYLERGQAMLRLHRSRKGAARCDAVLFLAEGSGNPNSMDRKDIGKLRRKPTKIESSSSAKRYVAIPVETDYNAPVLASIENGSIRLSFVKAGNALACRTEIMANGIWRRFFSNMEDHKILLLNADSSVLNYDKFFPSWNYEGSSVKFDFMGKSYAAQSDENNMNPFLAGELSEAIAINAVRQGKGIRVDYVTKNGSAITGLWSLPEKGCHIELDLSCRAADDGHYSMGVAAFQPVPENAVDNVLMAPMFQYKRLPATPQMLTSSMMQQPYAIIGTADALGGKISSFVSGDDTTFPAGQWGCADWSPIGFSLKNHNNEIQAVAFAPVMGEKDSRLAAGETVTRKFILGVCTSSWDSAVEYISDNVYKVRDYRKQTDVSLTDAMFNIFDLMLDIEHGGWDDSLKGFYDIEGNPGTAPTVVHSAPLAIVGAAILSDDEDFYLKRALPTIEYTLSRSGYRWASDIVPDGYNKTAKSLELSPFASQFNTSCYEGIAMLTGGLNPWLSEIALPDGEVRQTSGYSMQTVSWVEYLSAYRMTGDRTWLDKAVSTADRYIDLHLLSSQNTKPVSYMSFYNSTNYAPWWYLIDLYEITKDRKYIDAACRGAAHTIAGIRNYPAVKGEVRLIHPGGKYDGNTTMWWKGKEKFRLGFPRVQGDVQEKAVEDWKVSPVGLGFEQPSTYFLRTEGKLTRPVFMSSWAPHLLRLYRHTGKEIYLTYARNAVIGRFGNYPGYYATGFTDVTMSAGFPYKGPDVSSIYYHHIPPHLAFTCDYLVTEAIGRSKGNVDFPYSLQEGFVWFTNRIYGGAKGRIFSDKKAELWMRKSLISLDTPQVNYVTARSDKNFWILLSSESDEELALTVGLLDITKQLASGEAVLYGEKGRISSAKPEGDRIALDIPAKGFRAVCLPLNRAKPATLPALKKGMKTLGSGTAFGDLYFFRIRSPFGFDSVYGYAGTSPKENLSVEVECNGETVIVDRYPFEWSFDKVSMEENAVLTIKLRQDGKIVKSEKVILNK